MLKDVYVISFTAGKQKNIETRLNNTPLAKTKPKSLPIVKLINISANKPTIVVTDEEEIAEKE